MARRRGTIVAALSLLLLAVGTARAELAWDIRTVDGGGNGGADVVGQYTSLALNSAGYGCISYYDATNGDLRYVQWDGASWQGLGAGGRTVDATNNVGQYTSLALDAAGAPHVSYYAVTGGNLKYAAWSGAAWAAVTVDTGGSKDVGSYSSLALDADGRPHISYVEEHSTSQHYVDYASYSGSSWTDGTRVDPVHNYVAGYTSLALDAGGDPRVAYHIADSGDLVYTAYDGGWPASPTTVASAGDVGQYASLVLDASGYAHVSYYDATNGDLNYVYYDGSGWRDLGGSPAVDSTDDVGLYTSLALDANGYLSISYYDQTNNDLKYACWDGAAWHTTSVDTAGDVGLFTSLALDADGVPHISYYDAANGDLKIRRRHPRAGRLRPGAGVPDARRRICAQEKEDERWVGCVDADTPRPAGGALWLPRAACSLP